MDYAIDRITNTAHYQDYWFTAEQLQFHFKDCTRAAILALMLRSTDEHAQRLARGLSRNLLIIKADARDYINC